MLELEYALETLWTCVVVEDQVLGTESRVFSQSVAIAVTRMPKCVLGTLHFCCGRREMFVLYSTVSSDETLELVPRANTSFLGSYCKV